MVRVVVVFDDDDDGQKNGPKNGSPAVNHRVMQEMADPSGMMELAATLGIQ
jgi:hypothetical protein